MPFHSVIGNTLFSCSRFTLVRLALPLKVLLDQSADLVLPEFLFRQLDNGLFNSAVQGTLSAWAFGRVDQFLGRTHF